MAVSRGGVAFWVGCVRSRSRRQPIKKQSWALGQAVDLWWIRNTRPLSSAPWALAPPNSLRYQSVKQPALSHPFHNASPSQRGGFYDDVWDESLGVCVLVRRGESDGLHFLQDIPLFGHFNLRELLSLEAPKSFSLTTVDGSQEDDISMRNGVFAIDREHGCFRSLFEAERCPAPFMNGSQFYCFHCPGVEPVYDSWLKSKRQDNKSAERPRLHPITLCLHAESAQGGHAEGDNEEQEKMAVMYERLRIELPKLFMKNHDYTMYSYDVEFINSILNFKTRGLVQYKVAVSLWSLLCLCYLTESHLEVLKLTKHVEDGTIQARWRIKGIPFHSVLLRFYRKDKSNLYRTYDAFSTFYLGGDGLIHCHKVEKVMPVQPPVLPTVTSLLAGALVALGAQEHRPALNLLPLLLSSLRHSRN
ncbi:hypothetical protein JOB18_002095 [Solea senegalensis]|uniref:Uncharacterized protein n=1 Tax=Solea senegalensis TaxID=28829 RepID=A0AAV6R300_SOLSE|nr:uncharacterized protein C6orf136 homolog [Solea senegalensis]XP_043909165.1 uncharacterized protein C6orf136 homolog [Solea senegalensis]KAG7499888.1 hypothetical protein JOB18_002095 [Solea senegalensis]KAG7499889.1 hypothetical protein JOB18_002095 [Solea senegalensis]KAG7499890.1 hypothetical protein JOB18_002095 [Solea senegalensis]